MVIFLKTIKYIWDLSVKAGLVCFTLATLVVSAISLFSIAQKGSVYYGNRCIAVIDSKAINYLNQEEIIAYDYDLKCNTLYLDLNIKDELNPSQIIALLTRISVYYESINVSFKTHVTVKNATSLILANLQNGSVSLSISYI